MLSKSQNDLLTQTGPGTPMGDLFRRFWLPVMLAEELPGPDCDPKRLRVLGEDLIAFKDSTGQVGVVDAYCPHRGAPMSLGKHMGDRLACIYHGVQVGRDGTVLSVPGSPGCKLEGQKAVRTFPSQEIAGAIFIYVGDALHPDPVPFTPPPQLASDEYERFLCYTEFGVATWFDSSIVSVNIS